jgi:hypothetical protein
MKTWTQAFKDSIVPAAVADAATLATVALCGRRDSGSAIAPVNASSHVIWGERAAAVERATLRHTLPGVLINAGAGLWWALVFEKLFGAMADRHGAAAAATGGAATAALAYAVDYHLVPRRLTPGWEHRMSGRSVATSLAAMGAGLAVGAVLSRRRRRPRRH